VAAFRANGAGDRADLERHARSAAEILGRDLAPAAVGDRLVAALEARLGVVFHPATFEAVGIPEPR
jgi:hypothetical protein